MVAFETLMFKILPARATAKIGAEIVHTITDSEIRQTSAIYAICVTWEVMVLSLSFLRKVNKQEILKLLNRTICDINMYSMCYVCRYVCICYLA